MLSDSLFNAALAFRRIPNRHTVTGIEALHNECVALQATLDANTPVLADDERVAAAWADGEPELPPGDELLADVLATLIEDIDYYSSGELRRPRYTMEILGRAAAVRVAAEKMLEKQPEVV